MDIILRLSLLLAAFAAGTGLIISLVRATGEGDEERAQLGPFLALFWTPLMLAVVLAWSSS